MIVFSYPTAGEFWLHAGPEYLKHYSFRSRYLTDLPGDNYRFKKNEAIGEAEKFGAPQPVHLLVFDKKLKRNTLECVAHFQKLIFPRKSFFKISYMSDVYLPCPELCFLLAARYLSLPELALFGSLLCSNFYIDINEKLCSNRKLITTKDLLGKYIDSVGPHFRHMHIARKALLFVVENAFSPREVKIALILCLPIEVGGYGLELAELNVPVELSEAGRILMGVSELKGDMLWRGEHCVVEYDSTEWHASSIKRDCDRRTAFQISGYNVFSITKEHLANFGTFDATMCALCSVMSPDNMVLLDDYRVARNKLFYSLVKN